MNVATIKQLIIDLGFTFRKTDDEHPVWLCEDEDGIPMCSSPWLGECVLKVESALGGV